MSEATLLTLRAALYNAMQTLKGEDLNVFWDLIDEVQAMQDLFGEMRHE